MSERGASSINVHAELRERLRAVAQRRETITYQPIANALGIDLGLDSERGRLGRTLGDISRVEHADGRPLLSAVVVLGSTNVPGKGFFDLARELGAHRSDDDLAFFTSELRRVHDYWSRQPPRAAAPQTPPPPAHTAPSMPCEGAVVAHPIHGVGVVELWKDGFPSARVQFPGGTHTVSKDEVTQLDHVRPHSDPLASSLGAGMGGPRLRRHSYDRSSMAGWRSYPVRVQIRRLSRCCDAPMLLVQSMAGGFVRPNCSRCGTAETLGLSELLDLPLWVRCPECRDRMVAGHVPNSHGAMKNYGFSCRQCGVYIWLADLFPHWEDL